MISNRNIRNIIGANFFLQFFYAWAVIYIPIYLHLYLGFDWKEIGVMFTIMLLPFVLFEYPLGKVEDTKWGEKEILVLGFIITIAAIAYMPFATSPHFLLWTILLFMTRVGASFIEISSETYFFKHVDAEDVDMISLYRLTRPMGYIVAPLVAAVSFFFLSFANTFFILAAIMCIGIVHSLSIRDTR